MNEPHFPRLILLRHGQAEPYRIDDASRALVPQGIAEVRRSAEFLAAQGYLPTALIASPYRRAQQTADVVKQHLALQQVIASEALLMPDADVAQTGALLAATMECMAKEHDRAVLLVATHMPLVAGLRQYFTGEARGFPTGALTVVERRLQEQGGADWRLLTDFAPG